MSLKVQKYIFRFLRRFRDLRDSKTKLVDVTRLHGSCSLRGYGLLSLLRGSYGSLLSLSTHFKVELLWSCFKDDNQFHFGLFCYVVILPSN